MSGLTLNLDEPWPRLRAMLTTWERTLGEGCGAWLLLMPPPLLGQPCDHPRPCQYFQCRWHLAVEWNRSGNPVLVHPDEPLATMRYTCLWDLVDDHPSGMETHEVGEVLGLDDSHVGKLQETAKIKMQRRLRGRIPSYYYSGGTDE